MSDKSNIDKVLILLVGDSKEYLCRSAISPFYSPYYEVTSTKWREDNDSTCVDVKINGKEVEVTIQIYNHKFLEKLHNSECESPSAVVYVIDPGYKKAIENMENIWVKKVNELFPNLIEVVLKCEPSSSLDADDITDKEELRKFAEKIGTSYYELNPYSYEKPFDDFFATIVEKL